MSNELRKIETLRIVQERLRVPTITLDEKTRDELFDGMLTSTMVNMYNIANQPEEVIDETEEYHIDIDEKFENIDDAIAAHTDEEDEWGVSEYMPAKKKVIYNVNEKINAARTMVQIAKVFDERKKHKPKDEVEDGFVFDAELSLLDADEED